MKQYMIDQLREEDFQKLEEHLNRRTDTGELPGIYWVPIPETLYEGPQREHTDCQPFYFAVNLDVTAISFEFLIRTRSRLRCSCIQYANDKQRAYILDYADKLLGQLQIMT
jgi:hypothetical protein